jgi:hypothetical protein
LGCLPAKFDLTPSVPTARHLSSNPERGKISCAREKASQAQQAKACTTPPGACVDHLACFPPIANHVKNRRIREARSGIEAF